MLIEKEREEVGQLLTINDLDWEVRELPQCQAAGNEVQTVHFAFVKIRPVPCTALNNCQGSTSIHVE